MLFRETGTDNPSTIVLLHGGGLSDWSWNPVVEALGPNYRVITPIIDGHGDDGATSFVSIEDSAAKLVAYIDEVLGGRVYALGGLSIGAQIAVEALALRPHIAEYALIESAAVLPSKLSGMLAVPLCELSYPLIRKRWFSDMQAKALCVPEGDFDRYYRDSCNMSKQSLVNILRSNASYRLKDSLRETQAKVLVAAGSREIRMMRLSAEALHAAITDSRLFIADGMKHGELSLLHPDEYVKQLTLLFSQE